VEEKSIPPETPATIPKKTKRGVKGVLIL